MCKKQKCTILGVFFILLLFGVIYFILDNKIYNNKLDIQANNLDDNATNEIENSHENKNDAAEIIEKQEKNINNENETINNNGNNNNKSTKKNNDDAKQETKHNNEEIVNSIGDNITSSNNSEKTEDNTQHASQQEDSNSDDNTVDTNNLDYHIHRGRIDCSNLDDCMSISMPIQYQFKKSILNSFYIEVIAKNDNTLGYFIEYIFKEYNYGSKDECEKMGSKIKQTLSNKVKGYNCDSEGVLKIITDY